MRIRVRLYPILFALFLTLPAAAQTPSPRRSTPTLTGDGLLSSGPSAPASPDSTKVAAPDKPPTAGGSKGAGPQTQGNKEFDAAEQAWNERLSKAREKVKDLERRADQAELEATRLRNFQFSAEPRDPGAGANVNARVEELTELARRLRAEAKLAQEELDTILEEGAAKKFQAQSPPPTTRTGEPNPDYFHSRFAELQGTLRDAEARAQVMQLRINDLRFRINNNARTGDNFFLNRLRAELEEAENGLELARARIAAVAPELEELRRQARLADIPLGDPK